MNNLFRYTIILTLCLFAGEVTAKSDLGIVLPVEEAKWSVSSKASFPILNQPFLLASPMVAVENQPTVSVMSVPRVYDYHALGVFCKFDVQLDKGSKIPLRFRLGTVDGMDELERKGPTRYNY